MESMDLKPDISPKEMQRVIRVTLPRTVLTEGQQFDSPLIKGMVVAKDSFLDNDGEYKFILYIDTSQIGVS